MEKKETKMQIPKIKLDDLFSTQEQRDNAKLEKIVDIKIDCIDDFPNHPFKISTVLYPEWPLFALPNADKEDVKKILEFEYKIVLITKQEANIINKQFKSTGSFTERSKIAKIEIVEKSKCLELIKKYKK